MRQWGTSSVRFQTYHKMECLVSFVFYIVCLQMSPEDICLRRRIVALVAFVWLFSTVHFQMCPQIACLRGRVITLVAFVWLFSAVRFQMCPQMACLRGCIITLVAFVRLFSTVYFQMSPQIACMRRCKVTLVAFVRLNGIVSLFLQDFLTLQIQTKDIILTSLLHCVVFCLNGSFKLIQINDWVLINNHLTFPWHTFTF